MDIEEMLAQRAADPAKVEQHRRRMLSEIEAHGAIEADIWLAEGMAPSVAHRFSREEVHELVEQSRIPEDQLDFENVIGLGQSEQAPRAS